MAALDVDGPWARWWRAPAWHTTTWLATHPQLRGWFLLHELPEGTVADVAPVAATLAALARDPHPCVARVHHVAHDARGLRWVTDVAPGESLGRALSRARHTRAPFSAAEAARRACDLAAGLGHLRARSTMTGPFDLLGAREGVGSMVILDGWRAGALPPDDPERATFNFALRLLPPEALRGAPWDPPCDVWVVAALLYECLFAEHAFEGANDVERIRVISGARPPPRLDAPGPHPKELLAALRDALAPDPSRRTQDLAELARALAPFAAPALDGATAYRTDPRAAIAAAAAAQDLPRTATLLAASPAPLTEEFSAWLWRAVAASLIESTRDGRCEEPEVILWTVVRDVALDAIRALRDDRRTRMASAELLDALLAAP